MKIFLFLILFFLGLSFFAQEDTVVGKQPSIKPPPPKDTSFKDPGFISINISQTALSNWQGGGQDNFSIISLFRYEPTITKTNYQFSNKIEAQYGLTKIGDVKIYQKNIDRLFLLSRYDYKAAKKFYYSAQVDLRTQFSPGYVYQGDSVAGQATSDFFSPGYIQQALGIDYKPVDYLSITLAPIAGKVTIVQRQYLADQGAFGVQAAKYDANGVLISHGKRSRFEFGGRVIIKFKKDLVKNVNLDSYIDLFSNYVHNPQNIDVMINNTLTFRITKYFTASIISQLLYDDDVIIKRDWNKDGKYDNPNDINGPRLQALTTFAFGFGYKF
jgi:hypothetical protein